MFEDLKRTFNLGGTEIRIETDPETERQNSVLSGNVVLTAPAYEQTVDSLALELKEFWPEIKAGSERRVPRDSLRRRIPAHTEIVSKTHATLVLDENCCLKPNMKYSYPFELYLPRNCRLSSAFTGWGIELTMDTPNIVDPSCSIGLKVKPSTEILAITNVCEQDLGCEEKRGSQSWDEDTGRTLIRLSPPSRHKNDLNHIDMVLALCKDGEVRGDIIVNLKKRSLLGYVKALMGDNKVKRNIGFEPDQLLRDGRPNKFAISQIINSHIKAAIRKQ